MANPSTSNDRAELRVAPRRGRRFALLSLITLVAIALAWLFGVPRMFLHSIVGSDLNLRDYEAAERHLGWIETLQAGDAETLFLKARVLRKQLAVTDVPKFLKQALAMGYDRDRIQLELMLLEAQTGRLQSVASELHRRLQTESVDGREICESYVNGSLMLGDYASANAIFTAWKAEFPDDPQPHYQQARILEHQQGVDKAIQELLTALQKNPRHWPSRYSLSRIYFDQNKFDEAVAQIDAATEMHWNAAPLYQKAKCLRAKGQLQPSREILLELVKRKRPDVQKSFNLVSEPQRGYPIEYELGMIESTLEHHNDAVHWLDIVLNDDPNHLDARYARALSIRSLGDSEKAESELKEVNRIRNLLLEVDRLVDEINKTPNEPHIEARCRIGELFLKYQNASHGLFWLHDTLNRDPNYTPAHRLLQEYYEKLATENSAWSALAEEHRRKAEAAEAKGR